MHYLSLFVVCAYLVSGLEAQQRKSVSSAKITSELSATVKNAKKCKSVNDCSPQQKCKWDMCLNYINLGFEGSSSSTNGFPKKWKVVKDSYGKANRKFVKDSQNATEIACQLTYVCRMPSHSCRFPKGSRNPKAKSLPVGGTGVSIAYSNSC